MLCRAEVSPVDGGTGFEPVTFESLKYLASAHRGKSVFSFGPARDPLPVRAIFMPEVTGLARTGRGRLLGFRNLSVSATPIVCRFLPPCSPRPFRVDVEQVGCPILAGRSAARG